MNQKLWILVSGVFWAITVYSQVTTGTISGTVSDSSGGVLPRAKIGITNEGTGAVRTALSGPNGYYSVPLLTVGSYKVAASIEGFQTGVRSGIVLTVGREAVVDMKLQVGAVTQTVEVTGEAPLVQTTEATVSYLVSDQTLRDLPLNGRDMSQLILLNPGVTDSETIGRQAFNGYGRRISISGARGEDNTFLLDGGLIGDFRRHIPAGPSGSLLGLESVQEFQVLTNAFGAQYGRTLGGVFNSVSKSGTNAFHGDAYEYLRNDVLDARKWEDNAFRNGLRPPFRRNQFGGTVGGPIRKDKMFFFAAYEGTRERLASTVIQQVFDDNARQGILPASVGPSVAVSPLMVPYLNMYPRATPGARNYGDGTQQFVWAYSQPTTEDFGQGRIDLPVLTDKDSFFLRFTGSSASQDIQTGFPGYIQASSLSTKFTTVSETHIFSPTLLNTVRVHFSRVFPFDDGRAPAVPAGVFITPGQNDPPQLSPGTVSTIGGGGFDTKPNYHLSNRYTYQDDAIWTVGGHSLQMGGMAERLQYNSNRSSRDFGVWTWPSLQHFLAGTCGNLPAGLSIPNQCRTPGATAQTTTESRFRGTPPGTSVYARGFRQWFFALYLQDNWRVNSRLTLNLGVRWEPYTVAKEVSGRVANMRNIFYPNLSSIGSPYWLNKSLRDIGPRFGFAYDLFGTGKTSVRGGFGLLYEPNDPNEFYNPMPNAPPLAFDFDIPATGHFPNARDEIAGQSSAGVAFVLEYWNNKSPHMMQYNFTIQQQIGASNMVSVGYVGSRGNNLVGIKAYNTPFAVYNGRSLEVPTEQELIAKYGTTQPNTNYTDIHYFAPFADSWYNSLQVSYQRRFAVGLQAQLSYTLSKTLSTSDVSQQSYVLGPGSATGKYSWDNRAQKGLSGYDIRNSLVVNYSYDLPFGRGMSGVLGKVLSGWQTTGILTMRSGHPATISVAVPTALSNIGVRSRSPNTNPNFTRKLILGTPSDGQAKYFDRDAFQYNVATGLGARELGNLGRNTLIGPGLITWNPALFKNITLKEPMNLNFRMEMFNALNRPNYSFPAVSLAGATGIPTGTAGDITSTVTSARQIQFALKFIF